ncbi:30S ribosomal protein S5 [Candidatus Gracilibacteria bacterium]|nr:30S ribosomal protein S5 [Candidatus Gracilibacteria bacterium]
MRQRQESGSKNKTKKEFDELLLEVRRVTRVTTGGRRLSFRATVLVGNKKGKIGIGLSKGGDVTSAIKKASNEAYKNMFQVPITRSDTVPYPISLNYKACFIKLLPASAGTGLKAGSSVRAVLELAGYGNVLSKIIGSNNKLNNALATIKALSKYKHADFFVSLHEKKPETDVSEEGDNLNNKEVKTEEKKIEKKVEKKVEVKTEEKKIEKKVEKKVEAKTDTKETKEKKSK